MDYDDKTMALANHLSIDPALIENNYSHYYTVNERTEKEGKTPEQYQTIIEHFRALMSPNLRRRITRALNKGMKDSSKRKLYDDIASHLEGVNHESIPYRFLKAEALHVVNIPYHLLLSDYQYSADYAISLGMAWLCKPVEDERKDVKVDDGEYLVLTDDEADDWEKEGLEQMFDDMIHGVPDGLKQYMDTERFVEENSGNRGGNIGGYDDMEYEEDYDGITYYIYRTN